MTDVLSDAAESLIRSGLDPERVKSVLKVVRLRWVGHVYVKQSDPLDEQEIRDALARGDSVKAIAKKVSVSERTVLRRRSQWL